jgi:hypothetical protein
VHKEPGVETGVVAALRLYDVASEIDLSRVEREVSAGAPTRANLTQARPKSISYGEPPIGMSLGRARLEVEGDTVEAEVSARVYDFGTVTIGFRIAANGMSWPAYVSLVDAAAAALTSGAAWTEPLERVRSLIGPALDRPTTTGVEEDYVVATVTAFDQPLSADEVFERMDVARLLSGESRPLSRGATEDLLRKRFSYYPDDLVVLTWDRALVIEPRGDSDVGDVLEVANAQLLELRYYDTLLDTELPRMYERIEQARAGFGALSRRRYADLARRIQTRVAEVTEIAERVDNALIVTEDVYLARVYGEALELFRVPQWQAAVDRKLSIMRETYGALFDEAATARAEYLEWAIVLLIVLEILLAWVF